MENYFIYCLIDPRDLVVEYVGSTIDTLERYKGHTGPYNKVARVADWVEELRKENLLPEMRILYHGSGSDDERLTQEVLWMDLLKPRLSVGRPEIFNSSVRLEYRPVSKIDEILEYISTNYSNSITLFINDISRAFNTRFEARKLLKRIARTVTDISNKYKKTKKYISGQEALRREIELQQKFDDQLNENAKRSFSEIVDEYQKDGRNFYEDLEREVKKMQEEKRKLEKGE